MLIVDLVEVDPLQWCKCHYPFMTYTYMLIHVSKQRHFLLKRSNVTSTPAWRRRLIQSVEKVDSFSACRESLQKTICIIFCVTEQLPVRLGIYPVITYTCLWPSCNKNWLLMPLSSEMHLPTPPGTTWWSSQQHYSSSWWSTSTLKVLPVT